MTGAALAAMRAKEGDSIVLRGSCYWRAVYPGFYQPIHLLARIPASEVRRPVRLCWGFRAALAPEDAHLANATLPVHLLTGVQNFHEEGLSRNRRSDLRRCRRLVEIRRLDDPSLLLEQGHGVFMSAARRLGYWKPLSERAYRERVLRRAAYGPRLLVAGLIGGRLRGYIDSYVVGDVLYNDEIFVSTSALRTGIGTGLYVETLETAARAASIRDVCNSLHRPHDVDLCRFKQGLGFRVVPVPAHAQIRPAMRAFLCARRPELYYRLTGDTRVLRAG
jgi:hypothetical protein